MKKGAKASSEAIRKMVETRKKNGSFVAWNKGKKGVYSKEHLKKLSVTRKELYRSGKLVHPSKGKHPSPETLKKMSLARLGRKLTTEWKKNISLGGAGKHKGHKNHLVAWKRILEESLVLEKEGYRVIPITKVIPDIIAIKDGKVFAFEVEYKKANNPNTSKYTPDISKYFDGVVWLIRKKNGNS